VKIINKNGKRIYNHFVKIRGKNCLIEKEDMIRVKLVFNSNQILI